MVLKFENAWNLKYHLSDTQLHIAASYCSVKSRKLTAAANYLTTAKLQLLLQLSEEVTEGSTEAYFINASFLFVCFF